MPHHHPLLEELEPRILYSADLAAALGVAAGGVAAGWGSDSSALQPHEQQLLSTAQPTASRLEIAFVDLGVPDAQTLIAGLAAQREGGRALEVVTIAAGEDGLAVISQTLQLRHDVSAVHLYSHGSPGQVQLGSSTLNQGTALQRAHELASWGSALTADADLLIYGCDVAATEAGQALVRDLAALTGADVAASTDATGAVALGGNWTLETTSGRIESAAAIGVAAQQAWAGLLATYVADPSMADGAVGSLRWAIDQAHANPGTDTVSLLAGTHRITLAGAENANLLGDFDILSDIDFIGATGNAAQTVIESTVVDRVFDVLIGNASFRNLTIQGGNGTSQGGAINGSSSGNATLTNVVLNNNSANNGGSLYNQGTLTLNQVRITGSSSNTGGGISNRGTLVATDVEISGNSASDRGGGVAQQGGGASMSLTRVTISGNTAVSNGGGVWGGGGTMSATNLTISGNTAAQGGGLYVNANGYSISNATIAGNSATTSGGGIWSNTVAPGTPATLTNTIIASNTGGNANMPQTSGGWNADTEGTAIAAGGSNINPTVAALNLGALADNGGFTKTHALLVGSVAINAGNPGATSTDQRGAARVGLPDIGAFEFTPTANVAPQGTVKTMVTLEDTAVVFSVADFGFSDATDPAPDALLAVRVTALPASGTLRLDGTAVVAGQFVEATDIAAGRLVYTPAANATGFVSGFTFQVRDSGGTANGGVDTDPTPRAMDVSLTAVNDPPVGTSRTVTALEDTAYTITTADFGFSDPVDSPANSLLAVKITSLPSNGSLTLSGVVVTRDQFVSAADIAAGNLRYTPEADDYQPGYTSLKFVVQDDGGTANGGVALDASERQLTIDVSAVNDAPAGTNKTLSKLEDVAYTLVSADFGFTDATDNAGQALLAVRITTLPTAGSLQLAGAAVAAGQFIAAADISSGALVHTPALHANGTAASSFTFEVQDNGGTANGGVDLDPTPNSVTFNLSAVNDAPLRSAGSVAPFSMLEDAGATALGLGGLGYAPGPTADESSQTLSYRVTVEPSAALGTVKLVDGTTTVSAGTAYSLAQLQGMKFMPAANASGGPATFSWTVKDNGGTSNGGVDLLTEVMTISVTPVNDAPSGTTAAISMAQDSSRIITRSDFGFVDAGTESHALAAVRLQAPTAGTLALAGAPVVATTEVTAAQLDAGQLVFTPAPGASGGGYASISFQVRDDGGTANGGVDLDPTTRTLSVNVTAAATAIGQLWFSTAGAVANVGGTAWAVGQVARFGDSGDTFDINAGVTGGTVSVLGGYTAPAAIRALHHVQSSLTIGTTGTPFTLNAGDLVMVLDPGASPATVTLNGGDGNPGNDIVAERRDIVVYRPAAPGNYSSGEYFMLLDNGVHVGATLYNVHGLSLVETPTVVGDTSLAAGTFVVAHSNSAMHNNIYTFSATGTGVGAATQTPDRSLLIDGTRLGLAANGDKVMGLHLVSQPTAFNSNTLAAGTLLVTVDGGPNTYAGVSITAFDVVAVTVTATGASTAGSGQLLFDGSDLQLDTSTGPNTAAVNLQAVTVFSTTPVNMAPVFTSPASVSVTENSTTVQTLGATDAEAQALSFSIAGGADGALFTLTGGNGLRFISAPNHEVPLDSDGNNVYQVQVRATDSGGASTLQSVNVTVSDVNDAPVLALPISDQTVLQGASYSFSLAAGTFVDPDGDSLLHTAALAPNLPLPAWLSFNATTRTFSGTPGQADVGAITLRLSAVDPDDAVATDDYTLTVTDVNDAPVITSNGGASRAAISSAENSVAVTTVTATDVDPAAPARQFSIVGGADAALFDIDIVTGVLRFSVAPDHEAAADTGANNVYEVTVQASDGQLANTQTLTVTVTPVNESAPVITSNGGAGSAVITLAENTTAVTVVTATDADLPAATLTYSIAGGADAAAFTINGSTGVLSFVSAPDFEAPTDAGANNSYFVDVAVSDGSFSSTQQIRVNVTDVGGPLVVTTTSDVIDGNVASVEALLANRGTDGLISLREAISAANQTAGADTIVLGAGNYGIGTVPDGTGDDNLDGDFDIQGNLTITGVAVASTVVDGNRLDRVFDVSPGASLTLGGLTVQGGQLAANAYGGGVYVQGGGALVMSGVSISANQAGSGAGLYVLGTLTATDTTVANNVAPNWGGGIYNDRGTVVLDRVTFSGNQAGRDGGGINSAGSGAALTLNNVTLSGNTAGGNGGGLFTNRGITINSSTIAFNTSVSGAAGLHLQGSGSATLSNSILYNPGGSGSSSALVSGGYNLDSDGSAGLAGSGDQSGTPGAPLNPRLGGLQDNGGATWTHALLAGSPAIDAGNTATATATDQRGSARQAAADIGAYEAGVAVSRIPVNTVPAAQNVLEDVVTPISGLTVSDPDDGGGLSQNELSTTALAVSNGTLQVVLVGGATVSAGASGSATLTLSGTSADINATLASLQYLGNAQFHGNDTLTVTSRDGVGLTDTDSVSITVTAVNDAPRGSNRTLWQAAGTSLPLTSADFGFADAAGESNLLAAVLLQLPSLGTLLLNGVALTAATEVTVAQLDAAALAFVPAAGAGSGPHATLDFQVRDDGGTASAGADLDPSPATLSLSIINNAPVITGPGTAAALTLTQAEGRAPVVTLVAIDPDASAVITYSIAGGADAALFSVHPSSGELRFTAAPDFENPLDADADRAYQVLVQASDGSLADTVALTVLVTDVEHRIDVTTTTDVVDGNTSSIDALWAQPGADGLVSLREALVAANQTPGLDTIGFDIVAPLLGGAHTMQLFSELPDLVSPVIIDGRSESDFSTTPVIELDGQGLLSHGLRLATGSDGSGLLGLAINRYTGDAVQVVGSAGHTLAGNHLGTDVTGRIARGNGGAGIWSDGSGITIGGTTPLDANVIAGNGSAGIWLDNSASKTVIAGNRLGLGLGGEALGNPTGIYLGSAVRDVRVGGTAVGAGNTIVHSAGDGIRVDSAAGSGNHWLANRIVDNGGLGVDLGSDGVTANDGGDVDGGPNNLQNHPLLSAAVSTGADAFVTGSLQSNPDTNYRVEFFSAAAADASGHGQGATWLGAISVSTNSGGNASFNAMLSGVAVSAGHVISAVAVVELGGGAYGDASEFGPAVMVGTLNVAPVIASDGGAGVAAVSVLENSLAVTRVTASDSNLPAQNLLYSIVGGADAAHFVIHPTSGTLTFSTAADFEAPADSDANNVYEVQVQVSDGALVDAQLLSVTVTDSNEFSVSTPVDADAAANSVAENAAPGTLTGLTAQASDADASNQVVSYTLTDSAGGLFSIDAATGVVRVAGALDAETAGSHSITVRASSSDGSSREAIFNIAVQDSDEFDVGALSDTDAAPGRAAETAAIGTPVGITAQASDADASNSSIRYTLDNDASGRFAIDADSGVVTVARALGEEGAATHRIVVKAQSVDGSSSARAFEVDAVPQNNHEPVITSDGAAATAALVIDEGRTLVTVVVAVDADLPPVALRYSLGGGADAALFSIDADSGALGWAAAPDFEAPSDADGNGVYEVVVSVSDGQSSASQALSVRVANVNEAPVFNRQALLLSPQGVSLVLQSRDPDGATAALAYEVMSTRDGQFELQGAPGGALRSFTQADVDAARVIFVASSSGPGAPSPSFLLAISDGVLRVEGGAPEIVGTLPAPPAAVVPAAVPEPAPSATAAVAAAEVAPSAPAPAPVAAPAAAVKSAEAPQQQPLVLEAPLVAAAAVATPPAASAERLNNTVVVPDQSGSRPVATSADATFWLAGLAEVAAPAPLAIGLRESAGFDLIGNRNASTLAQAMDAARSSDDEAHAAVGLGVASTALVSSGVSVGYVLWLARGGVLAASLMSSVPAWASVDPLPVLKHMRRGADGEADEGPDGDEIDPIDRLFSRARRLLAGTAPAGAAHQAPADEAPDRAPAGPTPAAGPPQREAEPWAS